LANSTSPQASWPGEAWPLVPKTGNPTETLVIIQIWPLVAKTDRSSGTSGGCAAAKRNVCSEAEQALWVLAKQLGQVGQQG